MVKLGLNNYHHQFKSWLEKNGYKVELENGIIDFISVKNGIRCGFELKNTSHELTKALGQFVLCPKKLDKAYIVFDKEQEIYWENVMQPLDFLGIGIIFYDAQENAIKSIESKNNYWNCNNLQLTELQNQVENKKILYNKLHLKDVSLTQELENLKSKIRTQQLKVKTINSVPKTTVFLIPEKFIKKHNANQNFKILPINSFKDNLSGFVFFKMPKESLSFDSDTLKNKVLRYLTLTSEKL